MDEEERAPLRVFRMREREPIAIVIVAFESPLTNRYRRRFSFPRYRSP